MTYTLKCKDQNHPLFLDTDGKTLTEQANDNVVMFDSVVELAKSLFNGDIVVPKYMPSVVVSNSDFKSLMNDEHINELTSHQTYEDDTKLLNVDHSDTYGFVVQRRQARMYLHNLKISLNDPILEKLSVMKIPKSFAEKINIGDTLLPCSDYSGKVLYQSKTYKVVDTVDTDLLYENHNINLQDCHYLAVFEG